MVPAVIAIGNFVFSKLVDLGLTFVAVVAWCIKDVPQAKLPWKNVFHEVDRLIG